jgi:hypothetical protein
LTWDSIPAFVQPVGLDTHSLQMKVWPAVTCSEIYNAKIRHMDQLWGAPPFRVSPDGRSKPAGILTLFLGTDGFMQRYAVGPQNARPSRKPERLECHFMHEEYLSAERTPDNPPLCRQLLTANVRQTHLRHGALYLRPDLGEHAPQI